MKIKQICINCKKIFYKIPSLLKNGRGKFCSRKCADEFRSRVSIRGKNNPNWKGGKIKCICKVCNKLFYIPQSWIRKGSGIFCSRKCLGLWNSKNRIGKNAFNWTGGKIENICHICYRKFYVDKSRDKKGRTKFCSNKCRNIWQSKNSRGKNNPHWKGGITPEALRIRVSNKYNKWRQDVFIRDNFTCQKCGDNTGGNLQVHHKKPFSKLIEEVKKYLPLLPIYEAAMTYTPLWNLDNGITLCEKCHSKINTRK